MCGNGHIRVHGLDSAVRFIRSTIPVPILFAIIGVVVFGLSDALIGRLLSQFISGAGLAALLSALWGAVMGYLVGRYVVRKYGLPHSATPYDVDAAFTRRNKMLRGPSLLCLLAIASTSFTGPADAQEDHIEGAWQQIESNAGACPKCRISIAQNGQSLSVVANNGWSAVVGIEGTKDPIEATGTGVWVPGRIGTWAGRRFNVVFRLVDQRLYMSMRVEMENGSRRLIKGVFGRVWFGA